MEQAENLKVFIVDDNPICGLLYQKHLSNLGYNNNHIFDNGIDCIKRLKEKPDVIFIDYQMKPYNGIEVLKMIRQYNQNIYSVIISGQKGLQIAFEAAKYGAFSYIIKGEKEFESINKSIKKIISAKIKTENQKLKAQQPS